MWRPRAIPWAVAVLTAGASLAAADVAPGTPMAVTERALHLEGAGRVAFTLDRDVYEQARADLGDLRIFDDAGAQVPFLLQRALKEAEGAPRYPEVSNRSFARGEKASVTLDFKNPLLKDELHLSLSGENFRRRVTVEGRSRRDPGWTTLTDDAYVFAIPGPVPARHEVVRLPENNFQVLRVTVHHDVDDLPRIEIVDAWVRPEPRRRPREVVLSPKVVRSEDTQARETRFLLDLGARHQPFLGLQVEARDPRFFRGVVIDARVEPVGPASADELAWQYVADGMLYRTAEPDGGAGDSLRMDVSGRARVLRLTVKNRDDKPLDVLVVTVFVPVERVAFEAAPGRTYKLTYGNAALVAPVYDLARTAGDPSLWAARAEEARLGEPVRAALPLAARPWTEQHPALLWGGLLSVVALMAAVTWRALRTAD